MPTQTAILASALLAGEVVSIKNAYFDFGISNIARECGRSIERKFGVKLHREQKSGKHRGGGDVIWFEYSLPRTTDNQPGIAKMVEYLIQQKAVIPTGYITDKQRLEATKTIAHYAKNISDIQNSVQLNLL